MTISKTVPLAILAIINTLIITAGLLFSIESMKSNMRFTVLNTEVSPVIFGFAIVYLGIRYYLKLFRLVKRLSNPDVQFNWHNFKGGTTHDETTL